VLSHVDHLQKESRDLQTKIAAHESTGRELATQLREASIKVKAYEDWANGDVSEGQAGAVTALNELNGKHELALQVIDELVGRVRKYKVYEKKAAMAVKVLGETIARENRRDVVDHVERILAHESEEFTASVKADLLECESIPEVNKRYGVIKRGVGAATSSRITEERAPVAAAPAAVALRNRPEGRLPTAGSLNEGTEGRTIQESELPPSRVDGDGGEINEQVRLARLLTRKANPHRNPVAING
jgi:signal recognition particle subunit SEC65